MSSIFRENELSEEESRECIMLVNNLEEELSHFQNYKVPPHFFGKDIQHIEYVNTDGRGINESLDNIEFNIHSSNKNNRNENQEEEK